MRWMTEPREICRIETRSEELCSQLGGECPCKSIIAKAKMDNFKKSLRRNARLHKDSLKHHLQDYCSSTSIHGVKYLGSKTTPLEKAWWAAMLVCCVVGNAYLIHKVWVKWNNSPVIVSFAETAMPVWEIPFPTITFCSSIKSVVRVFDYSKNINQLMNNEEQGDDYMKNISETDFKKMSDMSLICDKYYVEAEKFVNESAIEFLMEVAPFLNETTLSCKFDDDVRAEDCSKYFTRVLLDEGVCYSFNMLPPIQLFDKSQGWNPFFEERSMNSSWSLETGFTPKSDLYTSRPRRVLSAGARASMTILLQYNTSDFNSFCKGPIGGFKVLINNPAEFPLSRETYWSSNPDEELILMVQPRIMTTSNGLRPYDPKIRQCFFQNERKLRYFNVYTQRNCEVECLTNYTLTECGCVAFYMPRNESTPLCGGMKKECMLTAESSLRTSEIEAVRINGSINSKCNCLQACQSIEFDAESSQSPLNTKKVLEERGENTTSIEGNELSRVKIFFKNKQFIASRRSELFGMVDFFANCGGLLGLFCGISLLSICELVYYITIRFWANFHLVKKRHESMKRDDDSAPTDNPNNVLQAELKIY